MLSGLKKILNINAKTKKDVLPVLLGLLITCLFYVAYVSKPPVIEQMGNLLFDRYQRAEPRPYDPMLARLGQPLRPAEVPPEDPPATRCGRVRISPCDQMRTK